VTEREMDGGGRQDEGLEIYRVLNPRGIVEI
jgi:hypothetical protein